MAFPRPPTPPPRLISALPTAIQSVCQDRPQSRAVLKRSGGAGKASRGRQRPGPQEDGQTTPDAAGPQACDCDRHRRGEQDHASHNGSAAAHTSVTMRVACGLPSSHERVCRVVWSARYACKQSAHADLWFLRRLDPSS